MFTRNGFWISLRIYRSFMTDFTLRFVIIRALHISFIAYCFLLFFRVTRHTRPNPPFPIQYW